MYTVSGHEYPRAIEARVRGSCKLSPRSRRAIAVETFHCEGNRGWTIAGALLKQGHHGQLALAVVVKRHVVATADLEEGRRDSRFSAKNRGTLAQVPNMSVMRHVPGYARCAVPPTH
jgi:hypothetical protein